MDEKHYLHLTELGRDAAEKSTNAIAFNKVPHIHRCCPATAEADACRIEHDISAETYERLKESVTKNNYIAHEPALIKGKEKPLVGAGNFARSF